MDRAERIGLGVAVAGHLVLFGLLSVGFLATPNPEKLKVQPIDISLVKDVALEAEAPQAIEAPAQSIAPEEGEPEDAAPPEPAEAEPEPTPPARVVLRPRVHPSPCRPRRSRNPGPSLRPNPSRSRKSLRLRLKRPHRSPSRPR
ncbi:hypothetical protein [uncultured Sphingomonas sp.]|uniref:hypothetical protein n=1 Tax=uncultured Sphingomonas sp. TaxID=158754 RepID=UPI002617A9CB|nr:hypothetical protein [uncultured Sphingomonas sp.]